ncbi:MAG TPA: hypothetical protein VMZ30_18265 [Pyrinomonadaceae bacterium]|nr:hypothetical protein [Pyrinomonadaceae bacterium]
MKTDTISRELSCDRGVAERPRYYARQLITSDDLTLEQEYFRNKLRAHNRLLHGWGVVCGAHVCPRPAAGDWGYRPWEVVIEPGYIMGPYGDEIIIDCERVVDLRTNGVTGCTGEPSMESVDPWCSQVYVPRDLTEPLYVAVKYKESQTRPVRVQPIGCSCEDNPCEYSRLRDGYEIGILDYCPEGDVTEPDQTDIPLYLQSIGLIRGADGLFERCPPCPPEPWVVLARVTLEDDGAITEIDNCECRRIVISFGPYALRCHTEKPTVDHLEPAQYTQGDEDKPLKIVGDKFKPGMKVHLGPGVTVDYKDAVLDTSATPHTYTVKVSLDADARVGEHRVTLKNPDCATTTVAGKFRVDASVTAVPTAEPRRATTAPSVTPRGGRAAGRKKKNR